MKKPNGIILNLQYTTSFQYLSNDDLASLIRALMQYAKNDEEPQDLNASVMAWFEMMKLDIERDFSSYEEKCRVNSENGKKGGRPRKNQASEESECFFEKTDRFLKETEKGNNNSNNNNNNNINININREEVNQSNDNFDQGMGATNDLASRGMVSLSPKAPPPPEKIDWNEISRLGIPLSYAEERLERAEYFARSQKKSVADILYAWWQSDKEGTPQNNRSYQAYSASQKEYVPSSNKSYDLDEFVEAAIRISQEDPFELLSKNSV